MRAIIGIDGGNSRVKIVGKYGPAAFKSNICDYFDLNVEDQKGPEDIIWSYEGRKGFAGTLAEREDEFANDDEAAKMFGDTKAHDDGKIRILIGLHQYCNDGDEVYLVVGQPIRKHTNEEKEKIKRMLLGRHEIEVNKIIKTIFIEAVEVAPEGSAAFWADPIPGKIRIIDCGSGTVNIATIDQKRHINRDSTTLNFGIETVNNNDFEAIARGIIRHTSKKWSKDDFVFICGGVAELIHPFIENHYKNAQILYPIVGQQYLHPVFANAVGFYELAKKKYQR